MVFAAFPIHASQHHAFHHGPFHKEYFVAFHPERSASNTDSKQNESSSAVKNGCNTPCRRTGTANCKPEARSCPDAKAGTETRRCPGGTVPRRFPKQQQASTGQTLKSRIHHEETPEVAKVSLDVTGFGAEDVSIHVDDETFVVTVSGSRTNKLGDVFRLHRRFALDRKTAEVDKMSANLDGGILELVVPKKTTTGPRRIPIRVGSSESAGSNDTSSENDGDTPTDTTGAEERVVEPSEVSSDNSQEDSDEHKDEATDQHEQNREADSVEVETVQEDEDGDRDRESDSDSDSDKEEHEEDSRSGESAQNTISRTPSNETKDEESWMEVTK